MIFNPVIAGSGGVWKEVDRSYIAEHAKDFDLNVLMAVFTPYYPNQPMIIPASCVFSIGDALSGTVEAVTYGAKAQEEGVTRILYAATTPIYIGIAKDPEGIELELYLDFSDPSGGGDTVPDGWSIKYFIYEG